MLSRYSQCTLSKQRRNEWDKNNIYTITPKRAKTAGYGCYRTGAPSLYICACAPERGTA